MTKKYTVRASKNINADTALDTIKNLDFMYNDDFNLTANSVISSAQNIVDGIEVRDSRFVNQEYRWFMTNSRDLREELNTLTANMATAVREFNDEIVKGS